MFFRLVPALVAILMSVPSGADQTQHLFSTHCASCHGAARLGGIGPALIPENLVRLRKPKAIQTIANGRPATQMPAFAEILTAKQIAALVDYVYTPLDKLPSWGMADIRRHHTVFDAAAPQEIDPVFDADPLNVFFVVEGGDHHITVLDGDAFTPLHRFPTRVALHGGVKYSADGRFAYFASRDGWVSKYDVYALKMVAEVRAGINTRNIAVSSNGKWLMVANYLPHTVTVLDTRDLSPVEVIPAKGATGKTSRVSAVYDAAPRESFVLALKDIAEVWEIPYGKDATAGFDGRQRTHEESGDVVPRMFPIRRMLLDDYLDDFFFDQEYKHLIGASRSGAGQVVDLDGGRKLTEVALQGMPHLGSGITWTYQGRRVMATPHLKQNAVSVIDMKTWSIIKQIKTLGPGFFMRSHENSRYAWVDVFFGPHRDKVHVIDKTTLEIAATLQPEPGKTAAHVEFDRYGRHALLSIWDLDGALVVYNAESLAEKKRLPMTKPVGKYNVYNKITRSEGTSH